MLPHEKDILMEMEGLDHLVQLFQGFEGLLGKAIEEYGEYLDPNVVTALECLQYDVVSLTEGTIEFENASVPGLLKQLDDVADEVKTFDCGGKTKDGIPDED